MAIVKLPSGKWQVKIVGTDGYWITKSFLTKQEAFSQELEWKRQKSAGYGMLTGAARKITLDRYFEHWKANIPRKCSRAWQKDKERMYARYVSPLIGHIGIKAIFPVHIGRIFSDLDVSKLSPARQGHVYVLLRSMFGDAINLFQLLVHNPVLPTFKPRQITKEAKSLNLKEIETLLTYVRDKPYGVAIWLQLYLGLRVGEVQALRWEDVDLEANILFIRRTFVKAEWQVREYPKGRKHHSSTIPSEMHLLLSQQLASRGESQLVVQSRCAKMITYRVYWRTLKRYCREAGVPVIGTHGLRHSTGTLYVHHGASRDDLRRLFAHSSLSVTDKYIHSHGTNLERVAKEMRVFPQNFHGKNSGDESSGPSS